MPKKPLSAPPRRARSTRTRRLSADPTRGGTGSKRNVAPPPKSPAKASKSAGKRAPKSPPAEQPRPTRRRAPRPRLILTAAQKGLIVGIALIFLTAILVLSVLSPNQGRLTAGMARGVGQLFGWGGVIVPLLTGGLGFYLVLWGMDHPPRLPLRRLLGGGLALAAGLALASLLANWRDDRLTTVWQVAGQGRGGGYVGAALAALGQTAVGAPGAILLYSLAAALGAALMLGVSRERLAAWGQRLRPRSSAAPPAGRAAPAMPAPLHEREPVRLVPAEPAPPPAAVAEDPASHEAEQAEAVRLRRRAQLSRPTPAESPQPAPTPPAEAAALLPDETLPAVLAGRPAGQWELPDLATLLRPGADPERSHDAVERQAEIIVHTLESFGAPGRIVDTHIGPTVTQFGVEPLYIEARTGRRIKVKVSKIAGLADDLALALAAKSVRIEAPVPGKGYVGIEVPNAHKALVSLRDIMESAEFARLRSPLRLGLGQDVAGNAIAADLAKMPHLLIAGATGSGKSVCVNGIIACLLLQNTPDDLRFVMVDPKRVELTGYNGIPHLAAPVVVEMERVVGVLQWALREMDKRYQMFAQVGVRNLVAYNKLIMERGQPRLPYIVVIIDELADLMMTAPEETERALARLAQMARATGIHMIIATQRPSVDVVTGLIKANFPARIAFAVASAVDSRVVLDQVGAERLLGQGDMLFQRPDAPAPLRMQGCFVSDEELNSLIGYWRTARRFIKYTAADAQPASAPPADAPVQDGRPPVPAPILAVTASQTAAPQTAAPQAAAPEQIQPPLWDDLVDLAPAKPDDDADDLWEEALAFVRKTGKASTSLLQRRFRIGYTRAARLIDRMEEERVIGPPTGTSKARDVLGHTADGRFDADDDDS